MRIDLSKRSVNGVLFHKAVSHKYESLNTEFFFYQTIFKDTSGLNLISLYVTINLHKRANYANIKRKIIN